jgi:hypothetical protein
MRIVPALGAFAVSARASMAQTPDVPAWPSAPSEAPTLEESWPSQHPFLAKEMVGVSHGNIARVKELLARHQTLAKASWDWGFGDWETALGAASHVGNRAIAELLLENGAGPTIFSAAMLGQLDVVEGFAKAMPNINQQRGPHGIPLVNHARAGGPRAAEVLKYLESLGSLPTPGGEPLSDTDRSAILGRYTFGDRPRDVLVIDAEKTIVGITRPGGSRRNLTHLGKLEFSPVGAPGVRIRFAKEAGRMTLSVLDPDLVVTARSQ